MLNNRRRLVISAALLVLLAGGANALAQPTVRCVPNPSINPGCTLATTYATISLAVGAATSGDAIFVGPGTYNESVTIIVPSISLLGAQAGNDARVDRHDPTKESIVNGMGNPAFIVNANGAVIDGFTVTGGTATAGDAYPGGILVGSTTSGYYWAHVLNNILEGNGTGVYLYIPSPPSPPILSPSAVIEHNLFRNNTLGTGMWNGFGIVSNATFPVITENEFTGNKTAAIAVPGGSNALITNNTSENDGAFVFYAKTNQCLFSHNRGKNFGHTGVLPIVGKSSSGSGTVSDYADAAVEVGPGNSYLVISDNDLEKGEAPISNGIAFTTAFANTSLGTSPNFNVNVKNNKIKGFPENGIVAEAEAVVALVSAAPAGTLYGSWIVGNEVLDNGSDGIFIEVNNHNISLFDNEAEGNHALDCNDTSKGGGTLGTQNDWFNNTGNSSSPTGLCTPSRWYGHD
jgi:hypothetical protein